MKRYVREKLENFYYGYIQKNNALFFTWLFCSIVYFIDYYIFIYDKAFSYGLLLSKFIGLCIFSFICLIVGFFSKKISATIFIVLTVLSGVFFSVDLMCWSIFQSPLSASMLATASETNFQEAMSFVRLYFSYSSLFYGVCLFLSLCLLYWFSHLLFQKLKLVICIAFCILSVFGIVFFPYFGIKYFQEIEGCQYRNDLSFILPIRFGCEIRQSLIQNPPFDLSKYSHTFSSAKLIDPQNSPKKIVLILGESTQRRHMGIYGYNKNTSEFTQAFDRRNLLVFSDVISPHSHTNISLQKVLTFQNYENSKIKKWYEYNNLVNIFNSIDYETVWISNQDFSSGVGSNGGMANISAKKVFVSGYKRWYDEAFFDEKTLSYIRDNINNKNQFFIIHLMGAHSTYGNRYPKNFDYFPHPINQGIRNQISKYDNAVRYNDFVISQIFKIFSNQDAIVIYISDHGEEVLDLDGKFIGHSEDRVSRFMVEIPMLVYASNKFIKLHTHLYKKLQGSTKNPYMTDDLIHTIVDIANIQVEGFDPTRSIINDLFNSNRARIVGSGGGYRL